VLVVSAYGVFGGAESWLAYLLEATDRLDAEVVLLQDGPFRERLEALGVPVTVHAAGTSPLSLTGPVRWLTRELRRRRPDVVLANGIKAQLVAGPAGRLAGVPTVWAKHDHSFDRWLAVPVGRLSTRVVAAVEELGEPVRRRDVVVVPPPVLGPPASRAAARAHFADLGLALDERPTVVMATRLVPYKGVDDAVAALALPGGESWRLAVVGDDDPSSPGETERLRGLARTAGVADRVVFAGWVERASHWLAAFDAIAVLTKPGGRRTPGKEGFGTSAFEAMLAGVPVIGVEGGAVVRRLEGRAGYGVPAADPAAVAAALGRLADPAARAAAGRAARELVAGHPDAARCAELLVEVLADAASRARRPPRGGGVRR
jgi:glycosyltransferase involved in cell wall biosynthesis